MARPNLKVEILHELSRIEEVTVGSMDQSKGSTGKSARESPDNPQIRKMVDGFWESIGSDRQHEVGMRLMSQRSTSRIGAIGSLNSPESYWRQKFQEISIFGGPTCYSPRQERSSCQ